MNVDVSHAWLGILDSIARTARRLLLGSWLAQLQVSQRSPHRLCQGCYLNWVQFFLSRHDAGGGVRATMASH